MGKPGSGNNGYPPVCASLSLYLAVVSPSSTNGDSDSRSGACNAKRQLLNRLNERPVDVFW